MADIDLSLLRSRAQGGDPDAQYDLGLCYTDGDGVPQSDATAYRWLQRAADAGHADAALAVGRCFHDGIGVDADPLEAKRWYERALVGGAEFVHEALGRLLTEDDPLVRDVERGRRLLEEGWETFGDEACAGLLADVYEDALGDTNGAVRWTKIAAEAGDSVSMVMLGYRHRYGLGVTRDFDEMVRWYRTAADLGHVSGLTNLALCYQHGEGVRIDARRAFELMQRAADEGHHQAQAWIAFAHVDGTGCEPDPAEGRRRLEELADGDPEIAHDLADRLIDGPGLPHDLAAGLGWMRRAADEGYAAAHTYLGVLHWYGKFVEQDRERALELYRAGSALGDPYGTANLGFAMIDGEGLAEDRERGIEFVRAAAECGNSHAAMWIATRLLAGDEPGVERDEVAAAEVLERCIEHEEEGDVLYLLAELVRDGRGTRRDPERALELFLLAALDGRDTRVEVGQLRRELRE